MDRRHSHHLIEIRYQQWFMQSDRYIFKWGKRMLTAKETSLSSSVTTCHPSAPLFPGPVPSWILLLCWGPSLSQVCQPLSSITPPPIQRHGPSCIPELAVSSRSMHTLAPTCYVSPALMDLWLPKHTKGSVWLFPQKSERRKRISSP